MKQLSSLKNMLAVDFKRMTAEKIIYICLAVAALMPVLILVMTTSMVSSEGEATYTSAWQAIESVSGGSTAAMDITSMCNINLIYILNLVAVCLFIGAEYRCGYVKNLFTNHSIKAPYVLSKIIVGSISGILMLLCYFAGAVIGGKIAGLSFELGDCSIMNIICCMLSKCFFMIFMTGIAVLVSVIGKSRLWMSILLGLAGSMLLFTMISSITPLNSTMMNVGLCLAGGVLFGAGFTAASTLVLNKFDII